MALPKDIPTLQSTSSKNYTRPDNVFVSAPLAEALVSCDTAPASRPPCTDHFPIASVFDITPTEAPCISKPNFKKTDWPVFRQALKDGLGSRAEGKGSMSSSPFGVCIFISKHSNNTRATHQAPPHSVVASHTQ
ncbi:hypothetical protein RSAG8_08205, partial [Rhizoctonia solani AG-8 WAC10335]